MHAKDEFAFGEMRYEQPIDRFDVSRDDERRIVEQPWLAKQLAGRVEAPGHLEERAELLVRLARLPLKKQAVAISGCDHRDMLVEHLLGREEFGAALNLLHSDLARWLPDTGQFSDLRWLLETLLKVKKQSAGKKARVVFQTPSGEEVRESAAMLEALLEDALGAAAAAWVRCLCGPGGDHRVLEMPLVMADQDLAEVIFGELARDPRALALMMEEVRPQPGDVGLLLEELLAFLQRGAGAARYCHEIIVTGMSKMGAK